MQYFLLGHKRSGTGLEVCPGQKKGKKETCRRPFRSPRQKGKSGKLFMKPKNEEKERGGKKAPPTSASFLSAPGKKTSKDARIEKKEGGEGRRSRRLHRTSRRKKKRKERSSLSKKKRKRKGFQLTATYSVPAWNAKRGRDHQGRLPVAPAKKERGKSTCIPAVLKATE